MPLTDYDYTFKVLLIGNSGVGKSSIMERFTEGNFREKLPKTIGVDFKTKTVTVDRMRVKLQIWDTAGQERFQTITSTFYRGAVGAIIVYDMTDGKSFADILKWAESLRGQFMDSDLPVLFLGGNKCDLEKERKVNFREARKLASEKGFNFMEISARTGYNVDRLFQDLAVSIMQDKALLTRSGLGELLSETVKVESHSYDTHSGYYDENRSRSSCCS